LVSRPQPSNLENVQVRLRRLSRRTIGTNDMPYRIHRSSTRTISMQAALDLTFETSLRMTPPRSRLVFCPASGSIRRSIQKSTSVGPDNERSEVRIRDLQDLPAIRRRNRYEKTACLQVGMVISCLLNGRALWDIVQGHRILRPSTVHRYCRGCLCPGRCHRPAQRSVRGPPSST
jgi:hypothetical protein